MQKQLDFDFITRGDDHPYIIIVYADYAKYLTPTCHTPSHTEKMLTGGLLRMNKMNIENRWKSDTNIVEQDSNTIKPKTL